MDDGHMDVEQSRPTQARDVQSNDLTSQRHTSPSSSKSSSRQHTREASVDMLVTNENSGAASTDPSSVSETLQDQDMEDVTDVADVPSIDEQVDIIMREMAVQLEDNMVGYVVSSAWISRVLARSSQKDDHGPYDKDVLEGEVGPIDNTSVLLKRMS
jgi:ubiquitin carboxyl-terminal hydrolase 4/11/15